jgi:RimJ/RimL family protein N-acetyltransferase
LTRSIETERLLLRPWRDSDLESWNAMGADPRVTRFLRAPSVPGAPIANPEILVARLAEHGYGWWALEVKGKVPFAGVIVLQDVPFEAHFTPAMEVGWHVAAEHWGNGYATEGGRAALEFAFGELGRTEVVAITAKLNRPSQRVMERLGMTRADADDFEHPRVPQDSPLRPHVLYRARRPLAG